MVIAKGSAKIGDSNASAYFNLYLLMSFTRLKQKHIGPVWFTGQLGKQYIWTQFEMINCAQSGDSNAIYVSTIEY